MHDVLVTFVPLGLFMLIPIWIPLLSHLVGSVLDRLRPPEPSPVRVEAERPQASGDS